MAKGFSIEGEGFQIKQNCLLFKCFPLLSGLFYGIPPMDYKLETKVDYKFLDSCPLLSEFFFMIPPKYYWAHILAYHNVNSRSNEYP